jgi:hypothetical protein
VDVVLDDVVDAPLVAGVAFANGVVLLDVEADGVVFAEVEADGVVAAVVVEPVVDDVVLVEDVGVPFVAKVGIGNTARAIGLGPTLIMPTEARFTTSSIETLFEPLFVTNAELPSAVILMSVGWCRRQCR